MNDLKDYFPLISIITVCLNNAEELEKTIKSVIAQEYTNKEFIIIDGGSTDETLDIISNYKEVISCWISEKDNGIYDAMNKGISFAKGDFINFLNAGDYYHDEEVLKNVASRMQLNNDSGILYGLSENFSTAENLKYLSGNKIDEKVLWKGMPICHQSMFFNKRLFNELGFYDLSFGNMADYEFLLRYLNNSVENKMIFVREPLAKFNLYGLSDLNYLKNLEEIKKVSRKYYDFDFSKKTYFFLRKIKYYFLWVLKKIKIYKIYRKFKYSIFMKKSHNQSCNKISD